MNDVTFYRFSDIKPDNLKDVLNETSLRAHLMDHAYFDSASMCQWIEDKMAIDALPGCRIRAVVVDGEIAGWCGIQPDKQSFELAIVISRAFWGTGVAIFKTLLTWAQTFGHKEVVFHLLETRPEYRSLKKMASKVYSTEINGRQFTSYCIDVPPVI